MMLKIEKFLLRVLVFLAEKIALRWYIIAFIVVILLTGLAYYYLTPYGNGIGNSGKSLSEVSLKNSIYFSIVTISSLGYGDMHPMRWGKLLAGTEVLFGLFIMGIMLAKFTSFRLNYHVRKLYAGEVKKRIVDFQREFDIIDEEFRLKIKYIGTSIQKNPNMSLEGDEKENLLKFKNECTKILSTFELVLMEFQTYIVEGIESGDFILVVPEKTFINTIISVDSSVITMVQMIYGLPTAVKNEVMDSENSGNANRIANNGKELASFVTRQCKNSKINEVFERLVLTCNSIPKSIYTVPVITKKSQPDQRISDIEPQF